MSLTSIPGVFRAFSGQLKLKGELPEHLDLSIEKYRFPTIPSAEASQQRSKTRSGTRCRTQLEPFGAMFAELFGSAVSVIHKAQSNGMTQILYESALYHRVGNIFKLTGLSSVPSKREITMFTRAQQKKRIAVTACTYSRITKCFRNCYNGTIFVSICISDKYCLEPRKRVVTQIIFLYHPRSSAGHS